MVVLCLDGVVSFLVLVRNVWKIKKGVMFFVYVVVSRWSCFMVVLFLIWCCFWLCCVSICGFVLMWFVVILICQVMKCQIVLY